MKRTLAALCLVALGSASAAAYEVDTHSAITEQAVLASTLNARIKDIGISVGLNSVQDPLSDGGLYFFGSFLFERRQAVIDWIRKGSVDEDSIVGLRFLNHFYNPVAPAGQEGYLGGVGRPSLTWGLEPTEISGQDFSLRDARGYLVQAVMAPAESDRKKNLALLFRTMGHVVHLIQDLAQPQHTRNDSHGLGSAYEKYANARRGELAAGGYPVVVADGPPRFWVTPESSGLANYSNGGFVTAGTNFTGRRTGSTAVIEANPNFPNPSGAGAQIEKRQITDPDLLGPNGPGQPLLGEIWFVKTAVPDGYLGSSADVNPRTSTFSIFDQDLASLGFDWVFSLNRFNYQEAAARLVPRAVGYSAGLIDHFFRGKLEIAPPALGAYAVADHATADGFPTIRAKITNATPAEDLVGGTLVMIAKFHHNGCYQSDLSGEFSRDDAGNPVVPCGNYRSEEESMLVSAEQTVTLASGAQTELTFAFPNPIPMDATDLTLQVLYQGQVGQEADGFAVGARDIAEPTFVAVFNATDVFEIPTDSGNQFFYYGEIITNAGFPPYSIVDLDGNLEYNSPPDVEVRGDEMLFDVYLAGGQVATVPVLPEGRFARFALLVDPEPFVFALRAVGAGFNQTNSYSFPAKVAQLDVATNTYYVGLVDDSRGHKQWDRVLYYRYYPTASADSDTMPVSEAVDERLPVPAQMLPPP